MSSHNRSNVENARRFLWDNSETGDAESGVSGTGNARSRAAHTSMSRGGTGFSTRDFNVVDQSVNLMDLTGGNTSSKAEKKQAAAASSRNKSGGGGIAGLFRAKMETDNLNKFADEYEYGDADAMNQADAEENIAGKRRRFSLFGVAHPILVACRNPNKNYKRPGAKAILTIAVAFVALLLVFSTLRSFEELEASEKNIGSNSDSDSATNNTHVDPNNKDKDNDNDNDNDKDKDNGGNHLERFETIKKRILDRNVSEAEAFVFGSGNKKDKETTPQQAALDWLVSEDPANLPPDHEALIDRYGLAVVFFSSTNTVEHGSNGWKQHDHWLSAKGICSWHGVECLPKEQEASAENNYEPFTTKYDENNFVIAIKLDSNQIKGTIPGELGTAFAELMTIDLEDNLLTGTLPVALSKSPHLKNLLVGSNMLMGKLPQEYGLLENLHQLNVAHNNLEGPIWQDWESRLTRLRYFAASHNQLTGAFPDLSKMTRLTGLFLEGNDMEGPLPESLEGMTALLDLRISENRFSGPIAVLSALSNLETLHLGSNEFTGEIPNMFDKLFRLHELVFSNNKFEGPIPQTLTHLQALKTLILDSNQLEGTLPPGLGLLTDVITLSLRDNKFEGTIPTLLGRLDDVKIMSLNHNKLSGSIPSELGSCFRLSELHLQNNQLTGGIPTELGDLDSLSDFKLEANLFEEAEMPPQVCALRDENLSILTSDCKNTDRVACDCCTECH